MVVDRTPSGGGHHFSFLSVFQSLCNIHVSFVQSFFSPCVHFMMEIFSSYESVRNSNCIGAHICMEPR